MVDLPLLVPDARLKLKKLNGSVLHLGELNVARHFTAVMGGARMDKLD